MFKCLQYESWQVLLINKSKKFAFYAIFIRCFVNDYLVIMYIARINKLYRYIENFCPYFGYQSIMLLIIKQLNKSAQFKFLRVNVGFKLNWDNDTNNICKK